MSLFRASLLLSAMILLGGCTVSADKRPPDWAQEINLKTVKRLYRVDDGVFRSAKPSKEGWKDLAGMGIRTAVCLEINCDKPPEAIEQIHVGINPLHPVHRQFVEFLRAVSDPRRRPVLFYCLLGSDRSSWACAMYRVVIQGWSKDQALREMRKGGFGSGFGSGVLSLNFQLYLKGLDVDAIRKEINAPETTTQPATAPATQPATAPAPHTPVRHAPVQGRRLPLGPHRRRCATVAST